jgi:hypothetical protein
MGIVNFEHGTLIHGQQNAFGTFDADIDETVCDSTTNANLTLFLRIHFVRVDPTATSTTYSDADGTAVPIRAWTDGVWRRWKQRFISGVQSKWNGKFWLRTPATYSRLNWPESSPTHRCNLYCRMRVSEQSDSKGAHAVIPAVRVNGNHFFRSHMLLYSDRDLRAERLTRNSVFYTHLHEIGHLIGLDHPGDSLPACTTGGESACYAAADGDDRGIMGRGSRIYSRHAKPWQKAASMLTSTSENQWTVSMRRAYPQRIR